MSTHSGSQSNFSRILHSLPDPAFGVNPMLLGLENLLSGLGGVPVSVAERKKDLWVSVDKASLTESLTLRNGHVCY